MFCNFCEKFENSKWPPFLVRQNFFENRHGMTLKQWSKFKLDTSKRLADHDFQEAVFSFQTPRINDKGDVRFFLYAPFDIKDVIWQPFCFQNKAKITLRQAFLAIYILYKSDPANCNILNFRTYQ